MLARMWRKKNNFALFVGVHIGEDNMENSVEKTELPHDLTSPTFGYIFKENENGILKRYLHLCVYRRINHNSQDIVSINTSKCKCHVSVHQQKNG